MRTQTLLPLRLGLPLPLLAPAHERLGNVLEEARASDEFLGDFDVGSTILPAHPVQNLLNQRLDILGSKRVQHAPEIRTIWALAKALREHL